MPQPGWSARNARSSCSGRILTPGRSRSVNSCRGTTISDRGPPTAINSDVNKTHTPRDWLPYNAILGYRPRPGTVVTAVATRGADNVFRAVYTIDASGARVISINAWLV